MRKPQVSVITIFLNPGVFLKTAVESVFSQTFLDWELLLVDDGSCDSSTETARNFALRDPTRVRYLQHPRHENRGMSASRNLGLEHARGEFVAYIDADDYWMPEKLAEQIDIFERYPEVHMVYGPALLWRSWSEKDAMRDSQQELGIELNRIYYPPSLLPIFLRRVECTPPTTGSMVRRSSLVDVGGNESSFRTMYEDQVVFSKIASKYPIYVSSKVSAKVRLHENSCCAVALRERTHLADRRRYLRWLKSYLQQRGIEDTNVNAAWHTEWERYFGWKARLKDHVRPLVPSRIRSWLRKTEPSRVGNG